jgi:molecular chaperone GrpE
MDDLSRAESHGDLAGSPLEIVAQKIRSGFERFGVAPVGEVGEAFDPNRHEAIAKLPTEGATNETVADVIEVGYILGDRLLRPAKVAVAAPAE